MPRMVVVGVRTYTRLYPSNANNALALFFVGNVGAIGGGLFH